jgi:hypothetical protein
MPRESLRIDDQLGTHAGQRIVRLNGAALEFTKTVQDYEAPPQVFLTLNPTNPARSRFFTIVTIYRVPSL